MQVCRLNNITPPQNWDSKQGLIRLRSLAGGQGGMNLRACIHTSRITRTSFKPGFLHCNPSRKGGRRKRSEAHTCAWAWQVCAHLEKVNLKRCFNAVSEEIQVRRRGGGNSAWKFLQTTERSAKKQPGVHKRLFHVLGIILHQDSLAWEAYTVNGKMKL